MRAEYSGLGWLVRLQKKGNSYYLNMVRELVLGNGLQKGQKLYYYFGCIDGRKVVMVFLDGKERSDDEEVSIDSRTFLVRSR